MAWTVDFTEKARRQLLRIGSSERKRIYAFVEDRLADASDPKALAVALKGSELGGYHRFRVGDYRLVCDIRETELIIVVIQLGHRRDVYR